MEKGGEGTEDKFKGKSMKDLIEPLRKMCELAGLFFFLEESGRWKEHPEYEHKTFEEFVIGAINMDLKDYDFVMWLFSNEEYKPSSPKAYWRDKAKNLKLSGRELKEIIAEMKGEDSQKGSTG
jgi:hypothetical protein